MDPPSLNSTDAIEVLESSSRLVGASRRNAVDAYRAGSLPVDIPTKITTLLWNVHTRMVHAAVHAADDRGSRKNSKITRRPWPYTSCITTTLGRIRHSV